MAKRALSILLAALIAVLAPGLGAYRAAAAELEGLEPTPSAPLETPGLTPSGVPALAASALPPSLSQPEDPLPPAASAASASPDAARAGASTPVPAPAAASRQSAQPGAAASAAPKAALPGLETASRREARLADGGSEGSGEGASRRADFTLPGGDGGPGDASGSVAARPGRWRALLAKARALPSGAHDYVFGERRMAQINARGQGDIAKARRLLIADGGLSIALSLLVGPLIDVARGAAVHGIAGHVGSLAALSAGLVAAFGAYVWVEWRQTFLTRAAGLNSTSDYRVALADNLLRQEIDFHQEADHSSAELAKRVLGDTNYLSFKNVNGPLSLVAASVYAAFGTGAMFLVNVPIASVVTAATLAIGAVVGVLANRLTKLNFQLSDDQAELMRRSQEALGQAQTIKSFASEAAESARYAAAAQRLYGVSRRIVKLSARLGVLSGALTSLFTSYFIYIAGGWLAVSHVITFGQVVQLSLFASFASVGFMGLSRAFLLIKSNAGSSKIVRRLLDREPAIADAPGAEVLADYKGGVAFQDVSFAYPSRKSDGSVLQDVSFRVEPGQTVAFVGETGSGKSTISRLLLRLWDPQSGRILVDGRDLRGVARQSFLDHVAVVPQDTRLFSSTIRYNMIYGAQGVSDERLAAAIRQAKAEFVYNKQLFPQGLDTQVSEGGDRLSGGERQRIAIVRALLRKPSLLILDEATSALDNASEKVVQKALDGLAGGEAGRKPSTIVIAHRLTTIANADRIHVLDRGRIVESGTHAELLAAGGRYAELWKKGGYGRELPEDGEASAEAPASPAAEAASGAAEAAPARAFSAKRRLSVRGRLRAAWRSVEPWLAGDRVLSPILRRYRWMIAGAAALMALDSGLWLVSSWLLGRMLDAAEFAAGAGGLAAFGAALSHATLLIAATLTALIGLDWGTSKLSGILSARVLRDIQTRLMDRLLRREMSFHIKHDSSEQASRLKEDAESLARKTVDDRLPIVENLISLIAGSALLLHASLAVGLAVLALMPGLGVLNGYFGQKMEATYVEFSRRRAEYGRSTQEAFSHIQTIKMLGQEKFEVARNAQRAEALAQSGLPGARYMALAHALGSSLTDFFTKYSLFIGGAWLISFAMGVSLGTIVAMTLYAGFVKGGFDGLSSAWLDYKQSHGETAIIRRWLARRPRVRDAEGARPLKVSQGDVRFENVSFRYSADNKGGGLEGLSLDVKPGQTVAFVGETGSGKSTVLRLLQRLWDPQSGRVLIDGQDISKVTLDSLRRQIAVVPQETRLFNDTIRYNMLYGNEGAGEAELLAAIRAAKADFVFDSKAFPQGLETRVGEGGGTLSGGQAQRVAIVRALLKKPRLLVLDEATAKLDKQTEREIQQTLDQILSDGAKPTTFVVAHNLPTIKGADVIVVLDHGRAVEAGTHQELLSRKGAYYRLWAAAQQLQK